MDFHGATELLQAIAALAAVARLIQLNLARQFPALLAYLLFLAASDVAFGIQHRASAGYFWTYIYLEPVECIFGIVAVRELLALTFSDYPGIRTAGRWAMYTGTALALVISLFLTGFFWEIGAAGRAHSLYIYYVEISKRSVLFSLAVVIVTVLVFISRYPLHLPLQTRVCGLFFSAFVLSEAARLLFDSTMPRLINSYVDRAESVFAMICLFSWAVFLRRENTETAPLVRVSSQREDHLLQQLNSLNDLMARAARR